MTERLLPSREATKRITLLREAHDIEQAGGLWRVWHVAAVLGVATRTVYRRGIAHVDGRYDPKEVRACIEIRTVRPKKRRAA